RTGSGYTRRSSGDAPRGTSGPDRNGHCNWRQECAHSGRRHGCWQRPVGAAGVAPAVRAVAALSVRAAPVGLSVRAAPVGLSVRAAPAGLSARAAPVGLSARVLAVGLSARAAPVGLSARVL